MEKELLTALDELKAALKADPRVLALEAAEKSLYQDPTLIALAEKKDAAERAYEDVLAYHKETDPEARSLQKALYEAKLALDEHPLSQAYNAAYIPVRDLYMALDDILYGPFRKKSLFEGIY
jgi:hypothetical protein